MDNTVIVDPPETQAPPDSSPLDKPDPDPDHDPLALFRNNPIFHELDPPDEEPPPPVEDGPVRKKIHLSTQPTPEEVDYFMDQYDYDPNDEVVNNFDEVEAENFFRSKVVEYRKMHGLPI